MAPRATNPVAGALRLTPTVLATCCVPWTERGTLLEDLIRDTIRERISSGYSDLYVFGTAGEGHAVNDRQFKQVVNAFLEETSRNGITPMVGVISLSTATVIDRIEHAAERGCKMFQISLPNWGATSDQEVLNFFAETCGRFEHLSFLHYNLARAGRVLQPRDYARLATEHPNLVATKYGAGNPELVAGLLLRVPELCHFLTEAGFFYGRAVGPCGLISSVSSTNPRLARAYFDACNQGDAAVANKLFRDLIVMLVALRDAVGEAALTDGAYDKILARIVAPTFPLNLLPPWRTSTDEAFRRYETVLRDAFPAWIPASPN